MRARLIYLRVAAVALAVTAVAGCASQQSVDSIAANDEALCQYSAAANSASYENCKGRLQGQRDKLTAANAGRIEGYALLPRSVPPSTDVAGRCKADGGTKDCPPDVTGTIPTRPASPTAPKP